MDADTALAAARDQVEALGVLLAAKDERIAALTVRVEQLEQATARPAGWRLRDAREAAGLSQAALARRLRVRQGTISAGERGSNINPRLLVRWSTALGLDGVPGEDAMTAYWRGWDDCAAAVAAAVKRAGA